MTNILPYNPNINRNVDDTVQAVKFEYIAADQNPSRSHLSSMKIMLVAACLIVAGRMIGNDVLDIFQHIVERSASTLGYAIETRLIQSGGEWASIGQGVPRFIISTHDLIQHYRRYTLPENIYRGAVILQMGTQLATVLTSAFSKLRQFAHVSAKLLLASKFLGQSASLIAGLLSIVHLIGRLKKVEKLNKLAARIKILSNKILLKQDVAIDPSKKSANLPVLLLQREEERITARSFFSRLTIGHAIFRATTLVPLGIVGVLVTAGVIASVATTPVGWIALAVTLTETCIATGLLAYRYYKGTRAGIAKQQELSIALASKLIETYTSKGYPLNELVLSCKSSVEISNWQKIKEKFISDQERKSHHAAMMEELEAIVNTILRDIHINSDGEPSSDILNARDILESACHGGGILLFEQTLKSVIAQLEPTTNLKKDTFHAMAMYGRRT